MSKTRLSALALFILSSVAFAETAPASGTGPVVEEVVVTANRREQNIQDVASSIKVLAGDQLEKSGLSGVNDYIFSIPGADVVDSGTDRKISIRGISNLTSRGNGVGSSASPIGLYLGDTPIQGNGILPDIDLYDLARIEVLKGPQGTLYGEGSQGGAIKMIPRSVNYDEMAATLEATYGRTHSGAEKNRSEKAMLNLPLFDRVGLRLVGSRRSEGQFVDYFNIENTDPTALTSSTWRAQLDAIVTERLSGTLMLMDQKHRVDQFPAGQITEGDLRNRNREPQFADTDFQLRALNIDYDFEFATLSSSSSVFTNEREVLARRPFLDATVYVLTNPRTGGLITAPDTNIEQEWVETENEQRGFAQELRLVSSGDSWLQWIGGAFYRKRDNDFHFFISNSDTDNLPAPVGPGITDYAGTEEFEQYAVFGEITAQLPWRLEALLGVRKFEEVVSLEGQSYARGYFFPISVAALRLDGYAPAKSFEIESEATTPKFSLSWFATDDIMVYGLLAKGVRSGGANHNALTADVAPLFEPDELWAYEGGIKSEWLDGRLQVNLTSFINKWEDLQINTAQSGAVDDLGNISVSVAVVLNAAEAYSRGTEIEIMWQLLPTLYLGWSRFEGKGTIREGDSEGVIPDGTALPQLAESSYSAMMQYMPHWQFFGFSPAVTISTQKTGERTAYPPSPLADTLLPGFKTWNAGFDFSSENWSFGLTVNNFTDERSLIGLLPSDEETFTFGRPRTWTARVTCRF